jgi:hypothetical protein
MEGSELLLVCESGGGKPIPQVTSQSSENTSHSYPSRVQKTHPTDTSPEFRKPIPHETLQSSENPSYRYPSRVQKTHPMGTPEFREPIPQITPP